MTSRLHLASLLFCLCTLGVLSSCSSQDPASVSTKTYDVPPGPGSGQPFLYAARDTVWLSWVEPVDSARHALRYATLHGGTWSAPSTVATGSDWFVNWADVPSVRPLPNGRMAAHYLESSGSGVYAYDVRITQTTSGTWQEAVTPHDDGTQTEHGFVSLLPHSETRLMAVWLDGRKMADTENGHGGGPMTLRSGLLDASGSVVGTTELDDRTCECCPTTAVQTRAGTLVAYRDRTKNEIRNIQLVRYDGEQWSDPYLLHDDGWQINGCPVNGPALAADGDRVAAAWFTGADGTSRVQVATSDDGGKTFGAPVVLDAKQPQGYVDVVLLDDGSAMVSWKDNTSNGAALRVRHVRTDGSTGPLRTVASSLPSGRSGMPRMVRHGEKLVLAWVDETNDGTSQVRVGHLPVEHVR